MSNATKSENILSAASTAWSPLQVGALLAGLLFVAFPEVLLGKASFFFRDYGVLAYPTIQYARDSWWMGQVPLWNPLSNCGAPFMAQWGTMTLYPGSLIYILLPLPWSLSLFCFLHLWLGGVGMRRLAYTWTNDRFASAFAAVAYVFNGTMMASLVWPNYLVALGWMPWVIWSIERAWKNGSANIVWAGIIGALQVLAGVPEILVLTWATAGTLWFVSAVRLVRHPKEIFRTIARIALVGIIIAGLTAMQLLPFLELLNHSQRQVGNVPVKWAMPGWGMANFIVPLFHCFMTPQGNFFQQSQEFLSSYYPGIAALALGLVAIFRGGPKRRWLLGILIVFACLMSLGPQGFLYDWLKRLLPGLGLARYPVKFLFLVAFALPLLAAFALRDVPASTSLLRKILPWVAVTLLLCGAIAGVLWFASFSRYQFDQPEITQQNALWRCVYLVFSATLAVSLQFVRREAFVEILRCCLVALVWLDVRTHSPNQNPTVPVSAFARLENPTPKPPSENVGRLFISPAAERSLLHSSVTNLLADFTGKRLAFWSNLNLIDGVPKVNGSATLQVREQAIVQTLLYTPPDRPKPGLLDFLGVSMITQPGKIIEYTNRTSALSLITVGQVLVCTNEAAILKGLTNIAFNPREIVYLDKQNSSQIHSTSKAVAKFQTKLFKRHEIALDVESDRDTFVVIAQSDYPCWQATVNGVQVPIAKANLAFQAVAVPKGKSEVNLRYVDRKFLGGLVLCAGTLIVCIAILLRKSRLA